MNNVERDQNTVKLSVGVKINTNKEVNTKLTTQVLKITLAEITK